MSSTPAIEAQWKQEMVITFYGLFWIFSGKSKMMQDWRKLHSFKPNFGGKFSVSVVLTTDKCFADVSHKNLKVSVFFDEKTVLRCLTFEKREKKAKNVILQFFPFFPPPCYCHSQSFWPFFFLLSFCWLILLVGCLLYPEGNYWAFFSFKNEKKTLLGKNHVSFQFQYMWKWWKCKSVSFSLPWLPWHPIHLRKWDPKVHFHQVELPPGLRRWIHLSNIKDYHGKIIHHFLPSWKSLPPKSLTFKACPWDLWISMVGLGVVVVGGGVVGGGLGLHWTPAASVLSQSWIPQPSNLKFNYTFTLFPIKNFGPKRSFCNSVIHVGKMRGKIWLLC